MKTEQHAALKITAAASAFLSYSALVGCSSDAKKYDAKPLDTSIHCQAVDQNKWTQTDQVQLAGLGKISINNLTPDLHKWYPDVTNSKVANGIFGRATCSDGVLFENYLSNPVIVDGMANRCIAVIIDTGNDTRPPQPGDNVKAISAACATN